VHPTTVSHTVNMARHPADVAFRASPTSSNARKRGSAKGCRPVLWWCVKGFRAGASFGVSRPFALGRVTPRLLDGSIPVKLRSGVLHAPPPASSLWPRRASPIASGAAFALPRYGLAASSDLSPLPVCLLWGHVVQPALPQSAHFFQAPLCGIVRPCIRAKVWALQAGLSDPAS
jgi:hypothetical protein